MTNFEKEERLLSERTRLEHNLLEMLKTLSKHMDNMHGESSKYYSYYGSSTYGKTRIQRQILELRMNLLKISKLLDGEES